MPNHPVPDLTPGTTYSVEVRSTDESGASGWSSPVEGTTEAYQAPTAYSSALPVAFTAPPTTARPGGLYAEVSWQTDAHFTVAGVEVRPTNIGGKVDYWDVGWCEDPADATKEPTDRPVPLPPFDPIVVYAVDECGLSPAARSEVPTRARHMLTLLEQTAAESKLAERMLDDAPPSVPADSLGDVVGAIEAELAVLGLEGWIHASPKWAAEAARIRSLYGSLSSGYTTPLGHHWVFGGGYVDALGDVLVVTTRPYGWRSGVTIAPVVDHQHNRMYAVAERTLVLGYEAVLLSVTGPAAVADAPASRAAVKPAAKPAKTAAKK